MNTKWIHINAAVTEFVFKVGVTSENGTITFVILYSKCKCECKSKYDTNKRDMKQLRIAPKELKIFGI